METNDFGARDAQNSIQAQNAGLFSHDVTILGTIGSSFVSDVLKVQRYDSVHAIKILNPGAAQDSELVQRFLINARYNQSLSDFTNLRIEEIVEGPRPFYVMGTVAESNLKEVIRLHAPLDAHWLFSLLVPIAKSLDTIHQRNIIHGNIKPSNLLVKVNDNQESFVLCDYLEPSLSSTSATITGAGPYCAPEFRNGNPVSNRSDVYSLAAVVYEALTGFLPNGPYQSDDGKFHVWRGDSAIRDPHSLNPNISVALSDLLMKALSTQSIERPNSCLTFVEEALRVCDVPGVSVVAPKEQYVDTKDKDNAPVPMLLIAGGVFLAILILFGAFKLIGSAFDSGGKTETTKTTSSKTANSSVTSSSDPNEKRKAIQADKDFLLTLSQDQQHCTIGPNVKRWSLSLSTLHCPFDPVGETDPTDLWYGNFTNIDDLNSSYEGTAQTLLTDMAKEGGSKKDNNGESLPCTLNPNETGTWDARAIKGDPNSPGAYGKFTCVTIPVPKIIWTDEEKKAIGEATFKGKDMALLTEWWRTKSGPATKGAN